MNKSSLKETLLNFVVPFMALIVVLVLVFTIIIPFFQNREEKQSKIASAKELNAQLSTKLSNLNKLDNLKNVVSDYSALMNRVVVDEPMIPELLTQIDTIAKESGLEVTKLSYSFNQVAAVNPDENSYPFVNISLGADGNYNQLTTFFQALESAARLIYVDNFRYSVDTTDNNNLSFQITLASPYLKVESTPVTDEPVNIDIASADFVELVAELKKYKYYEPRVDEAVQLSSTLEETEESTPTENLESDE